MALKTFNLDDAVYKKFYAACRENGLSMSKQVEFFMRSMIEAPKVKKKYLDKLDRLREGQFVEITDFSKHFGLSAKK